MDHRDQQLRDAIRQLFAAQSQLSALKGSVAYKLACRAGNLFEYFVPRGGRLNGLRRAIRWAANVWLDEGLVMLGTRAAFKLSRAVRKLFGIGADGRREPVAEFVRIPSPGSTPAGIHTNSATKKNPDQPNHAVRSAETKDINDGPPITRLNLVYHVTPIMHPENVWQWNVGELLKRIHIFNGRRIITVATPTAADARAMDRPETVIDAFAGHEVEFRFAENDPRLREAPHFLPALREIASTNPSEAVFYAHTKGVSHRDQLAVRAWTAAMYHHNLDRIDEVQQLLPCWPCVGIAKRHGNFEYLRLGLHRKEWTYRRRPWHGWHFSGTFWWVRHDKLFSCIDWDKIDMHAYAVEAYLANFFKSEEAASLAYNEIDDPYDPLSWRASAA
jgi:hypothetical protein